MISDYYVKVAEQLLEMRDQKTKHLELADAWDTLGHPGLASVERSEAADIAERMQEFAKDLAEYKREKVS